MPLTGAAEAVCPPAPSAPGDAIDRGAAMTLDGRARHGSRFAMFAPPVKRSGPGKDPPQRRSRSPGPTVRLGPTGDALEREADRVAAHIVEGGPSESETPIPVGRAPVPGDGLPAQPPPVPASGGEPLPAADRGYFESRFARDFGSVRVHRGDRAAEAARALGARAYTSCNDIVFGAGYYAPGSRAGRALLAHELTHVVQQGGRPGLVQRSPLSDSVKAAWKADPRLEALLARLSKPDILKAQADGDIDVAINDLLAGRPDDLWVASSIRKGKLGDSRGWFDAKDKAKPTPRPVQAFFFPGSTARRALVIAGVHGSERQGMEVVEMLMAALQDKAAKPPVFTTIVVPSLFPDAKAKSDDLVKAAKGGIPDIEKAREAGTPTNRNFPDPSKDLAASGGDDKQWRKILAENRYLMELMERVHPERIISVHGTSGPGSAGIFYDPRVLRADEEKAALDQAAAGIKSKSPKPSDSEGYAEADYKARLKVAYKSALSVKSMEADSTDRDLSLKAAEEIDKATKPIKGRDKRSFRREGEPTTTDTSKRRKHPSVAGNIGPTGKFDNATWSGSVPGGVSLGGYAPKRGMSVFTVEPPLNYRSDDPAYPEKVDPKERKLELKAYADVIRTILLGSP